jgi:4-hydroxybenzoate polyprenyltransferase
MMTLIDRDADEGEANIKRGGIWPALKILRPHQWLKNTLVFVPLLMSVPVATISDYSIAIKTFVAFCLSASLGYILNDFIDRDADRQHSIKQSRPLASGAITPRSCIVVSLVLLILLSFIAVLLPHKLTLIVLFYVFMSSLYSYFLKNVVILDVSVLTLLYTIRLFAGQIAIHQPMSYWLLTFSVFFFLSLAFSKRCSEVLGESNHHAVRRPYTTQDVPFIMSVGISSTVASSLIFVIYLIDEQFPRTVYASPAWLWLVFPLLLYWHLRIWYLTSHKRMKEDAILFSVHDYTSWIVLGVVAASLIMAWKG